MDDEVGRGAVSAGTELLSVQHTPAAIRLVAETHALLENMTSAAGMRGLPCVYCVHVGRLV